MLLSYVICCQPNAFAACKLNSTFTNCGKLDENSTVDENKPRSTVFCNYFNCTMETLQVSAVCIACLPYDVFNSVLYTKKKAE